MEETIVIECSRQSSIEGTTGNYQTLAEWTCDCGNGIVLDIGDKIQVHSGFVSEKGAQAGEIEIKERKREDYQVVVSKDIQYSIPSPIYYPPATTAFVSYKEIYDWMQGNVSGFTVATDATDTKPASTADITVNVLNSMNNKTKEIRYYNAFPTDISGISFASTTEEQFLTFDITFQFDQFELI